MDKISTIESNCGVFDTAAILSTHSAFAYGKDASIKSGATSGFGPGSGHSRRVSHFDYWSFSQEDWAELDFLINKICDFSGFSSLVRKKALEAARHIDPSHRVLALANMREKVRKMG